MELIETPIFTRQVNDWLTTEEYRLLEIQLILRPEVGAVIPRSGGLRKLRWRLPGRGEERRRSMRKDLFEQLVASVKEMKGIEAGRLKPGRVTRAEDLLRGKTPDVAALRARFKLSQAKFAGLLGISVDTLQNWEQHRRRPEGPAKVLLLIVATHPEALLSAAKVTGKSRARPRRSAAA